MKTDRFRKLAVWNKSINFVSEIYSYNEKFPPNERYGLTDQLRRAAVSINLNIAEGTGAGSDPEFIRFLKMSQRSIFEVIAGLEIAIKLKYSSTENTAKLMAEADELSAMLTGLIKKLKTND